MNESKQEAQQALKGVIDGFLGDKKWQNYRVSKKAKGLSHAFKPIFLCSNMDFYKENLNDFSEKHGVRFQQDI